MPRTRERTGNYVVAREAIVIVVGARPTKYRKVTVRDRRTGDLVEINDTDMLIPPLEEEDTGIPYAFKENQKVSKNHPAVQECPGAFIPIEELDDVSVVVEA